MSVIIQGKVGPQLLSDGSTADLRQGKNGELNISQAHGAFYELASRGQVFASMSAATGYTVVAGNVSPVGAGAVCALGLWNPPGSGVNVEVLKSWVTHVSGTPGAGSWVYNISYNQVITQATLNAVQNTTGGAQAAAAKVFQGVALTGSTQMNLLHPIGGQFAGAIAATTPGLNMVDLVDGAIVLPPGAILAIAAPATGTSHVIVPGFMWAETKI